MRLSLINITKRIRSFCLGSKAFGSQPQPGDQPVDEQSSCEPIFLEDDELITPDRHFLDRIPASQKRPHRLQQEKPQTVPKPELHCIYNKPLSKR